MNMKLILAIVQNDDSVLVSEKLTEAGFFVTKLKTTGGFLRAGNITLMIGTEAEKVAEALAIIEKYCEQRTQSLPPAEPLGFETFSPMPQTITVGGATVFVIDVEQFVKL